MVFESAELAIEAFRCSYAVFELGCGSVVEAEEE